MLTDDVLSSFDTNYKLLPPLRTSTDIKALLKGIKEGVIDAITSDHNPIDIEHKKIEFDHALYGSIGLESCFGALNSLLSTVMAIKMLTGLKKEFSVETIGIEENNTANFTLFNPNGEWVFSEKHILSSSKNSALIKSKLKGNVYGIFANKKLVLNK